MIERGSSVSKVCSRLGYSRAAYYKQKRTKAIGEQQDKMIKELVMSKRRELPRLGGRKLYHEIKVDLEAMRIKIGRDRFFLWLGQRGLLITPKKKYVRTTNSLHRFRKYDNLIEDLKVTRPDQVWVSDITYIRLLKGFCYLALITDKYSRKIIGYYVSNTLELKGCLKALKMALRSRKNIEGTIHHSDRGIQYCSYAYTGLLTQNNIKISMAATGNCYENAMAERVNGILKNEFNLDATFKNLKEAQRAVEESIYLYNYKRPHLSLKMEKPAKIYEV